jgi:hypothetical protein
MTHQIIGDNRGTIDLDREIIVTCPACGFTEQIENFDTCGACIDQVLCPNCPAEFCYTTGEIHQPCPQCKDFAIEQQPEQGQLF